MDCSSAYIHRVNQETNSGQSHDEGSGCLHKIGQMRVRQSPTKRLADPLVPAVGFPASDRLQSRRRIWFELCDRPVLRGWRRRLQQPAGLSTVGRHDHFLPRLSKAALFILGGGASSCLPRVLPPRSQRHHCRIELANTAEQLNFQAIPNHRPFPKARSASWMSTIRCSNSRRPSAAALQR